MAKIKTNRTARITLMLAPETINYLTQLGEQKAISSVSLIADQVINEHRSFFSDGDNLSNCLSSVEIPVAAGPEHAAA